MKILLTGGAGFIGSCILKTLNDMGIEDIIVVDNIGSTPKWKNLVNKRHLQYIPKTELGARLSGINDVKHVIHMGACTCTTQRDFDYLYDNNVEYSKMLWKYCTERKIGFIYASSAAIYGDGAQGFYDGGHCRTYVPLNGYGYSKKLFDDWVEQQKEAPPHYAGLRFFNVYGPNEYHKDSMASVVYRGFRQINESGSIKLFKSHRPGYEDGGQLRDFVYVKDVCSVVRFFIENQTKSGLFNVGTGHAESFAELGKSIFKALGLKSSIEYIDMPESLRENYQYFTEADINKLRRAGYKDDFRSLEEGVDDYVQEYLSKGYKIW